MACQEAPRYRIGLIGCGGIAGSWIKAVAEHPSSRITLAFDVQPEAAERRATEAGARAAASVEEVLTDPEVDLVIVATPTPSHPELTVRAAESGKHVLCEKPMALDLAGCQRMVDACASAGVQLAVGHSLRLWSAFLTCRSLIAQGAIGTPVSGSIDRMGVARAQPASGRPAGAASGGAPGADWRTQVGNYGGMALEGFIHEMDFTRAVFGEVAAVSADIAGGQDHGGLLSPPILQALVRFESGALVALRTGAAVALPTMGYWVAGTQGGLRFTSWGGPVEHYRHDLDAPRSVACEPARAYYLELCDLLQAIEGGRPPENSGLNGKKNVALGLGIYRSFETGRQVRFAAGLPLGLPEDYRNTLYF
ncbi:MAG: Gfo/Idh/MocA family oxidoreductase [Candidatus Latescibacterota bacterium]